MREGGFFMGDTFKCDTGGLRRGTQPQRSSSVRSAAAAMYADYC